MPDEKTAIAIAVAVWNPIYGEKQIETEKPFHASLRDGFWIVTGSLPEGWVGGPPLRKSLKTMGAYYVSSTRNELYNVSAPNNSLDRSHGKRLSHHR